MSSTLLRKRDFYAGMAITLLGCAVALDSSINYNLGTLARMGPGMFPLMLGIVLAVVGGLIIGTAVTSPLDPEDCFLPKDKHWWAWSCILGGPILFVIFGERFGFLPATFACVFVSACGDRAATLKGSLILALGVSVVGSFLFVGLLQSPLPLLRWSF
ncbi:tripartite tricarboxylate transporter TctB family protein [Bradyrhizobium iriomotense]|uniref:tripartite tricarboxylate transporter TctB family protein n=1 Tax=Bradyrhizobium iriomotense TaxID=441950 RepID=UPI0032DFCB27